MLSNHINKIKFIFILLFLHCLSLNSFASSFDGQTVLGLGINLDGTFSSEKSHLGLAVSGLYGKLGLLSYGINLEAGYRSSDSFRGRLGGFIGFLLFNVEGGVSLTYSIGGAENIRGGGSYIGALFFIPLQHGSGNWRHFFAISAGLNKYFQNVPNYSDSYKEFYIRIGYFFMYLSKSRSDESNRQE